MTYPCSPRVLIVGKDGRTDAITAACAASPSRPEIYAFAEMPIPGLVEKCRYVYTGTLTDQARLLAVVRDVRPDLVIIGPEEPLEAGYVDVLEEIGIPAFGPSRRLAAIESSKSWARQLLDRYAIPGNPDYRVFHGVDGLREYMEDLGAFVVKPDGLTAGKGVRVLGDHLADVDDAMSYAVDVLSQSGCVQIEERIEGEEFSLQTITDGEAVIHCPAVQDHKRAFEGDRGPNTGGMGSYSCTDFSLPFLEPSDVRDAQAMNERVIDALARDTGSPYKGVLYGGFIATRDGIRLIEYNARFGDPEAMNILPLLAADFVELCFATAEQRLGTVPWSFQQLATVCKYVVPIDYPDPSPAGQEIIVPAFDHDSTSWFWAASTLSPEGKTCMTSSRAGAVVGTGRSLDEAEKAAERAASAIVGPIRHRTDIGRSGVIAARTEHMRQLRSPIASHRD